MEFVAGTGKTSEPHALEAVMNLQMGKSTDIAIEFGSAIEKGPSFVHVPLVCSTLLLGQM